MCDNACNNTMEEEKKDIVVLEQGTAEAAVNTACCSGSRVTK